jgi:hypothetical protein
MSKIGLALSGGGIKGIAHLGVPAISNRVRYKKNQL